MPDQRSAIAGSDRRPVEGARRIGDPPADRRIQVTLTLRRRSGEEPSQSIGAEALDRDAFAERYGADPADIEAIEDFASDHGLDVVQSSIARRTVVLGGTIEDMGKAFGAELGLYEHPDLGTFRGRTGHLTVPAEIAGAVTGVLGLDDRPAAKAHMRRLDKGSGVVAHAQTQAYKPQELAALYGFPTDANGKGQTVAIIELGGGFKRSDLTAYWKEMGVTPHPRVVAVSVDGAPNKPDGPQGADGEVMLDVEVVGAVAPGARIAVYFAPNTTAGFLDAITTAIHDTRRKPSVVSISWGQAEDAPQGWTEQDRNAYDQAFQDAAALGVTVCVAAGDDGSNDNVGDGQAHVDFPAASPWVLACGGTKIESEGETIVAEVTWHEPTGGATGGGVSRFFAMPAYQHGAGVPKQVDTHQAGRGVPDVAGDADPQTGYRVRVDGEDMVIGGTSAVAPLYAALIALINEKTGRSAGFVNQKLYAAGQLRDIVEGDNGAYRAGAGWDACTGLGSPDGAKVLAALTA
jgi:kumamolisin